MSPAHRRLLRESAPARVHLALCAVLGAATAVLVVVQAVTLARILAGAFLDGEGLDEQGTELAILAAALAGRALLSAATDLSGRIGAARALSGLRLALVGRLARFGRGRAQEPVGELVAAAVQGVDALEGFYARALPQAVLAAIVPVAVIGWMLPADPVVAGVLAATVPLLVVFMVLVGASGADHVRERHRMLAVLSGRFLEVVRGLPALRACNREAAQEAALQSVGERHRVETLAALRVAFLSALVLELLAMIGTALAAAIVGIQLVAGASSLEVGLAVLLLAPELYAPLRAAGQQFHAAEEGAAAAERLFAVLDSSEPLTLAARPRIAPDPRRASIRLEGVTVRFEGRDAPALDGLDLVLRPGETVALVGPNGAGKSTLARLLLRLADPDEGRVVCGGVDLREVDPDDWRAYVAWVPQHARMYAGTVADNVRLAAPAASDSAVRAALRAAGADFALALPRGLDEPIGEGGRGLSAGQAQRIALARALVADPSLLVLDEPVAHLDPAAADAVGAALMAHAAPRSAVVITHDPALASLADRVVVLDRGRVRPSVAPAVAA